MIVAFISLVIVFLIFRLILTVANRFIVWLGRGKMLKRVLDEDKIEAEYAEEIKQFVAQCDEARLAHKGFWSKRPKLTREQKKALIRATKGARDEYLDMMHLSWYQLVIIFLVGSFVGLILEEVWMYLTAGLTQSRVGLVWGPFSPLYGFGACFLTIVCWQLRRKRVNNLTIFLVSVIVGGTLEQFTGWSMETFFHASSWSYLHLPDHITQWIAWRFLFFWGLIGLTWSKLIMPEVLFRIGMPTTRRQFIFVLLLALYLAADIFMTMACFIRKAQRDEGIPAQNAFEVWIDEHYTNQFIAARFQNLTIGDDPNNN